MSILASFCKPEACGQTVLPEDKKKMVENAKTMRDFEYFSNIMFMLRSFICVLIAQSSCEEGDRQSHHHYIAKRYVTSINFSLID